MLVKKKSTQILIWVSLIEKDRQIGSIDIQIDITFRFFVKLRCFIGLLDYYIYFFKKKEKQTINTINSLLQYQYQCYYQKFLNYLQKIIELCVKTLGFYHSLLLLLLFLLLFLFTIVFILIYLYNKLIDSILGFKNLFIF